MHSTIVKKLFLLLVLATFLLTACAQANAAAQTVVTLPSPLQFFILSAITFLVGFIFSKIAEGWPWLGKLLGPYVDEVSVAAGGAVVLAIQNLLGAIPPQWEGVANAALALLVAILAAYGFLKAARKTVTMLAVYKLK
jgi:hypothetical protein